MVLAKQQTKLREAKKALAILLIQPYAVYLNKKALCITQGFLKQIYKPDSVESYHLSRLEVALSSINLPSRIRRETLNPWFI